MNLPGTLAVALNCVALSAVPRASMVVGVQVMTGTAGVTVN